MKKLIISLACAITFMASCVKDQKPTLQVHVDDRSRRTAHAANISWNGVTNAAISGDSIVAGTYPAISLTNCSNITIKNCRLLNGSNVTAVGIYLYKCSNINIQSNFITGVASGVYAVDCTGSINVGINQMQNMLGPFPRGQFVQFNNCSGPGNSIANNLLENIMGASYPEDAISMYESDGTAASPIMITGNSIRGGGPSTTGGGIMLGDGGGSYQVAEKNILVNPGQYGMAISGGTNESIIDNTIYGAAQSFTNVGIYVDPIGAAIGNEMVSGNDVLFYSSAGYQNNSWLAPGILSPAGWASNVFGAALTPAILPAKLITDK